MLEAIEELSANFEKCSLDVSALTDTKLVRVEKISVEDGLKLLSSCRRVERHCQGVGLLGRKAAKALCEWEPNNERLLFARSSQIMAISVSLLCTN